MNHSFTIHSNGNTAAQMKREFLAVNKLATDLEKALSEAAPNMRNYYGNEDGPADFKRDVDAFRERALEIKRIQDWAMGGALHVLEQENK